MPTDKFVRSNNLGLFSRSICHYSSSRDELAKLIAKNLKVPNRNYPTAPDLLLRYSVKKVRIIAGENNYKFIRGKDF
jgi:hypothetical protein